MAFKLNKAQSEQKADLSQKLTEAWEEIDAKVAAFNETVATAKGDVEAAVAAYNEILAEAREFAADIASAADEEISDKSDKWQEGERGQAAIEYKDAWESIEQQFDPIELEFPEELQFDQAQTVDAAGELDNAPEEANQ